MCQRKDPEKGGVIYQPIRKTNSIVVEHTTSSYRTRTHRIYTAALIKVAVRSMAPVPKKENRSSSGGC